MKKLLAVSLAFCLALSAVSCSKGNGEDTIKIGGLAPLTGSVSVYGNAVNNGILLAVEDINANGGINGKKIEYIVEDEKGDPTEAVNAYQKLVVNDKVVGIIGDVTSTPTLAVAQASLADNMPLITASGTAVAITATGTNVFRACFTDPFQGEIMAAYASKVLNVKTAAILYNMADDYSSGVAEAFKKEAQAAGITIVAEEKFQTDDADFKSQLTNIKGKNPDLILLPVYAEDLRKIGVQIKEVGITSQLMGVDGWDGVLSDENFNSEVINGGLYCSQYSASSTDPALVKFISNYKAKYNKEPENMFTVLGYDAMMIMAKAIEKAGSTEPQKIIDAIAATEYAGLTGNITFDENRNPVKSAIIMTVKDGAYQYVTNFEK